MTIKSYPKSHIYQLYSPGMSQDSARRRLNRWINGDRQLKEALRQVGYFEHKNDHYFTKKEVALLFEYIVLPGMNWSN